VGDKSMVGARQEKAEGEGAEIILGPYENVE